MKLSELLKKLGTDEYSVAGTIVFIYKRRNGALDTLNQVQQVEDDIRVVSHPPAGMNKVTNIYWDPIESKIAVEFNDNLI